MCEVVVDRLGWLMTICDRKEDKIVVVVFVQIIFKRKLNIENYPTYKNPLIH